jgi:hypothetical protein
MRHLLEYILAAGVGPLSFLAPLAWRYNVRQYRAPVSSTMATAVENFQFDGLLVFLCLSFLLGLMTRRATPYKLGLVTMAFFPALTLVEVTIDPRSHNLFPVELVVYAGMGVLAGVCIHLARIAKGKQRSGSRQQSGEGGG